jgi:HAD superfamily hydrolase (TIGR01490 family)
LKLSIYDLDRTLHRKDTFREFYDFLKKRNMVSPTRRILIPLKYLMFLGRMICLKVFKEEVLSALKGYGADKMNELMDSFAGSIRWENFRPDLLERIKQEKGEGYRIVLLTASPDIYAEKVGKMLGFDEVICTKTEYIGGVFTGKILGKDLKGEAKVERLMKWKEDNPFDLGSSKGYGNSDDLAWLDMLGKKRVYD